MLTGCTGADPTPATASPSAIPTKIILPSNTPLPTFTPTLPAATETLTLTLTAPVATETTTPAATEVTPALSSSEAKAIIAAQADDVIHALQTINMRQLATHVHQERGLRFSPYASAHTTIVFSPKQLRNLPNSTAIYTWGQYDGSGKPINLPFDNYFQRFVYSRDFANAEQISYNKVLGRGNATENSFKFYPGSILVEYYFSGLDSKYGEMDFQSLRLIFQLIDQKWYLVAIIHNEWTI